MTKFEQIVDHFIQQIEFGELKPGDRLPSTRRIEEMFGVSYGSVRGAMLVLKAKGLVRGRQGKAVYVVGGR